MQQKLFVWWHSSGGDLPPLAVCMAEALVLMRRTGLERYNWRTHRMLSSCEARFIDEVEVSRTMRLADPPGTLVEILGEDRQGVVTHVVIAGSRQDPCPAPWYVVACPALRACRAHGADELERAGVSGVVP